MPRLGAAYDLTADGRTVVQATYGHYAGKYNDVQFSRNSNVGNADRITGSYIGPAGEGRDFAAGFDPANYQTFTGTFPTANVFFDDDLESPLTREFTLACRARDSRRGWARATYVKRHATHFVEDFITMAEGQTDRVRNGVNFGTFDNAVYRNTNLPNARLPGAAVRERLSSSLSALAVNGHWTVQLQNDGTFEGESSSGPAQPSLIADYPEIYVAARSFPDGRLDDFQRNKVRVWASYRVELGRFGVGRCCTALSLQLRPHLQPRGGRCAAVRAADREQPRIRSAADEPVDLLRRSAGRRASRAITSSISRRPIAVPVWQSLRPWVKVEVLNAFNNQKLVSWNTSVTADTAGPKDENGLPINYIKSAAFGTASGPVELSASAARDGRRQNAARSRRDEVLKS